MTDWFPEQQLCMLYGCDVNYADMVDRFEVYYRTPNGTVGGYGSQTNGTTGSGTRFYDDNSIVGIELVEAFNLLNNQDYLTKAKRIVEFLQAGEDDMFEEVFGGMRTRKDSRELVIRINRHALMDMQRYSCLNIILYVLKRKKRMCWLWQNVYMLGR